MHYRARNPRNPRRLQLDAQISNTNLKATPSQDQTRVWLTTTAQFKKKGVVNE